MKVLVTGAKGFIGKNLIVALERRTGFEVIPFDLRDPGNVLETGLAEADAVVHLAGINRPEKIDAYDAGNAEFTRHLCERLMAFGRSPHILFSSSVQAALDNPYGLSKRKAEEILLSYAKQTGAAVSIFRLTNVFGKWSRPHYNSVVATFCHNIARNEPIAISDPSRELDLVYIDDVVASFLGDLESVPAGGRYRPVDPVYRVSLGALAETLRSFRAERETLTLPDLGAPFIRKLYATYLSYLPEREFAYRLTEKTDNRGELAELLKSTQSGQMFVSRTRPGITRGHHYHDTKVEKFIVVSGEAVIRFRKIETEAGSRLKVQGSSDEEKEEKSSEVGDRGAEGRDQRSEVGDREPQIIEYRVSGDEFTVVDIPPGYTHSIENIGQTDLIVLFWACEIFDPGKPDTFAEIV